MGKKVCSVLTACFVFTAALHLEAVVQKELIYYPSIALTWEEARLHCQKTNVDLITMEALNAEHSVSMPNKSNLTFPLLWIGLVRHPEDARVWKEVSFR